MTALDFETLLLMQDGKCAICLTDNPKRWHLDHDHDTGIIRGILCMGCNITLGHVQAMTRRTNAGLVHAADRIGAYLASPPTDVLR